MEKNKIPIAIALVLVFAVAVVFAAVLVIRSTASTPIVVQLHEPTPTPRPTPGPDIGFRSLEKFATLPTTFTAADFPNNVPAQTRHLTAPGCGGAPSGTKFFYVYAYPQSLGEPVQFGFSSAFNDVGSLTELTGFTDEGITYRVYTTPAFICNVVGGHEVMVLP